MAHLSRWQKRTPRWLGNADAAEPFAVEVKRLSEAELRAFFEGVAGIGGEYQVAQLLEVFSPCVRGPKGLLTIDGEEVADLRGLLTAAAGEFPGPDSLLGELVRLVQEVNGLGKGTPSGSEPQPGGSGGTAAAIATSTAAPAAGSQSSTAST